TVETKLGSQMVAPPLVDLLHQLAADAVRRLLRLPAAEPDEGGVGVAIDHLVAARLDQLAGAPHDLVSAQGDRGRQARVEEAAAARTKHAVEGIHDEDRKSVV